MQRTGSECHASTEPHRCAYCEGQIRHEGHIEHFRRKNATHGFPYLTFAWENLFLACGSKEHCGHYKDRKGAAPYDPANLIKPDQDDPEQFLYFHSSGEVRPRTGENISPQNAFRASETIRVFGLDTPVLKGARHRAIQGYKKELEELEAWLAGENETEQQELLQAHIQAELEETKWLPYATTIKHFFTKAT